MRERGWSLLEVIAAMVIIGIGVVFFVRMQRMNGKQSGNNTRILKAGHLIEKNLEDMRIQIYQDTVTNWPPRDTTIAAGADKTKLVRTISNALSPIDGAVVNNVKKVVITTSWGTGKLDTLKVTTYVSKRF